MRLALCKDDSVKGPLPEGWDANQLTIEQIKAILSDKLPGRLRALGWTPYELTDVARLKEVITTEEHHPNSPLHRRYTKLGGDDALYALTALHADGGTFKPESWPTRVTALEKAQQWLQTSAATAGGPLQPIAQSKGPAGVKPKDVAKDWKEVKQRYEAARYGAAFSQRFQNAFDKAQGDNKERIPQVAQFIAAWEAQQEAEERHDYWRANELLPKLGQASTDLDQAWNAAKQKFEAANDPAFNKRAEDCFAQLSGQELEKFVASWYALMEAREQEDYWRANELLSELDVAIKKSVVSP